MARPKEFDVDDALDRALGAFWRKGYAATSVQDLVTAMGIERASLYGTFGDKRALYLRALRSYQARSLAATQQALGAGGSPKAAVRRFVLGVAAQAGGRQGRLGCMCVNANVELAPHDPAVGQQVREHGARVEALLAAALRRAMAAGELPAGADCRRLALLLFGLIMALNVLGKQSAGPTRLTALARQGLAALDT